MRFVRVRLRNRFLMLKDGGEIRAALRICQESGPRLLRGMRVSPAFQGLSLGKLILTYFAEVTNNENCYFIA